MPKYSTQETTEALESLRRFYPAGSTVYTILRHVSRSGRSRTIGVVATLPGEDGQPHHYHPNWSAAVVTGSNCDRDRDGVKVTGGGMDMGYHLAYGISARLFPNGFGCIGEGCPSNDHSNGDRDQTPHSNDAPHWHTDGGYALRHRWL